MSRAAESVAGDFDGKAVAVTGGSSGIGLACAHAVVRGGGSVAIQARRPDPLARAARDLASSAARGPDAVVAVPGDANDPDQARALVDAGLDRFGRLDGFVAGDGIQRPVDLLESGADDWRAAIEGNLVSAVVGCQTVADRLEPGGSIVLLGSVAAFRGSEVSLPYAVAKGGLALLAKSLAGKLGSRGLRVNCVVVGTVDTAMLDGAFRNVAGGDEQEARRLIARAAAACALGRIGQPEEVAEVVAFLLSRRASFVTGSEVLVDGGHLATLGRQQPSGIAGQS